MKKRNLNNGSFLLTQKERLVLYRLKRRLEKKMTADFDKQLSQKIDCVTLLLEE